MAHGDVLFPQRPPRWHHLMLRPDGSGPVPARQPKHRLPPVTPCRGHCWSSLSAEASTKF